MPCFAASCAVVSSPRSASSATCALNSAEYRVRFPVISSVLFSRRTELISPSKFPGPPQFSAVQPNRRGIADFTYV